MTAVELLPPGEATPSNEAWHQLRRAGITASEIAVVMELSPYDSPFNLFHQKVNGWRWEGNDLTSAGRHLEDAIADWWGSQDWEWPDWALRPAGLYASQHRLWQLATPDRLVCSPCANCGVSGLDSTKHFDDQPAEVHPCGYCGGTGDGKLLALLECKWVAYSWDGWGEPGTDEVPIHYRAQALWQLDTLGVDEVHFAALGPGGFRSYLVRRDEADLELMRKAGEDFVRRLTEGDPPPLDSHSATLGALKRLYPIAGDGEVQVPHSVAFEYRQARLDLKRAEERAARWEAEVRDYLEDEHSRAVYNGHLVASRSVFEQKRIDSKRLKAERPEIAAAYTTTTTVDRLNPGRTPE